MDGGAFQPVIGARRLWTSKPIFCPGILLIVNSRDINTCNTTSFTWIQYVIQGSEGGFYLTLSVLQRASMMQDGYGPEFEAQWNSMM